MDNKYNITLANYKKKYRKFWKIIGIIIVMLLLIIAGFFDFMRANLEESKPLYTFIIIISLWISFSYYLLFIRETKKQDIIFWLVTNPIIFYLAIEGLI